MDNQSFGSNGIFSGQPSKQPQNNDFGQSMMGGAGGFGSDAQVPTAKVVPVATEPNSGKTTIFMVLAIVAGLIAVTFIGLFIWMYSQWDSVQADVNSKVNTAVAEAVNEKVTEMENAFTEREKMPYRIFTGPADYGELTLEYPKTWSVYEPKSATSGGDFEAYFNPDRVYGTGAGTINSLRVIIKDQAYENAITQYEQAVKSGKISLEVRPIGGENANVYTGVLPGTNELQGIAAVFKIRDKTAIIQTDAMLFADDYYKILDSVKYNS